MLKKHSLSASRILRNKVGKFLIAGGINTVFGYLVYAALIYAGLSYLIALLISTIAGVVFNFFSFGHLVFGRYKNWLVFIKFIIFYIFIYLINGSLLNFLIKEFFFSPYMGQILCIPSSAILSWLLMKYWVYK